MSRFFNQTCIMQFTIVGILTTIMCFNAGCSGGGSSAKGTTVKGLVTIKGVPAGGLILNFQSADNQSSSTTTLPDGKYVLEGVPAGPVIVYFTSVSGMPGGSSAISMGPGAPPTKKNEAPKGTPEGTISKAPPIPPKYSKPDTSDLKYTIEGKEQTLDITVP